MMRGDLIREVRIDMLYKMHINKDELAVMDEAMQEHITLMDIDTPVEAAESAAKKIKLLREYVDLNAKVTEVIKAKDSAKKAYNEFAFNGKDVTSIKSDVQ